MIIFIDTSDNEDKAEFFDSSDTRYQKKIIHIEYMICTYICIDLNSYQDEGSLEVENDETSTVEIADHSAERSQMGNYYGDICILVL